MTRQAGKTIVEKIFSAKAGRDLAAGDMAVIEPDFGITHDINASSVFRSLDQLEHPRVAHSGRYALFLDHLSPAASAEVATSHNRLEAYAREQGIRVYPPGRGICHQLMLESGKIRPGSIVVGTDSHTCTYGSLNALGISVGASEMAVIFSGSRCWFKVPESIRVNLTGKLRGYASSKDVALEMIRILGEGGAVYRCVEFGGEGLRSLSMDARAVLTNMCIEMGAKTAVIEADDLLAETLKVSPDEPLYRADDGAAYCREITIPLDEVVPVVSLPEEIATVCHVSELVTIPVTQVVIGSCTNGRVEDFIQAADILRGRTVAEGVRLVLVPASREVYLEMMELGVLRDLVKAGALVNPPGCGPCAGLLGGLAGDGDVVVSTTNRCLRGRMGSNRAEIYLSSPATAAFSALYGRICCQHQAEQGEAL